MELPTMATTQALSSSHMLDDDDAPAAVRSPRPSLMRRFYDAMIEMQLRRAQREVDRLLGAGAYARAMRGEWPGPL